MEQIEFYIKMVFIVKWLEKFLLWWVLIEWNKFFYKKKRFGLFWISSPNIFIKQNGKNICWYVFIGYGWINYKESFVQNWFFECIWKMFVDWSANKKLEVIGCQEDN